MYVPSLISIPFVYYKKYKVKGKLLCKYTGKDYGSCALPFYSLPSIYKPSFILIPLVPSKDMARTGNNYEKWLRGDNTVNIQGKIMVLGFCPSPHCSIYQVCLKCQLQF